MDALLGAAGEGDIGELFPDSDQAFAGASSMDLLRRVMARLAAAGWSVANVDVTLVCEQPHLAGYRAEMRDALASALSVESSTVSVKATTTEGMGFEGRGEGIAAHAVCLIARSG
jgi:2-C-methyl-D-erythritol 2,4-cyclodiphosphate synthase